MNDTLLLAMAGGVGLLLGLVFYGGLWLTVDRSVSSETPALWFAVSLVLRMAIVIFGFWLVSDGDWRRLLLCLLGLMAARPIVSRLTAAYERSRTRRAGAASHGA